MLEVMRGNVDRGDEMIKQILLFARGVQGKRAPLQPKHLVKEIVKILGETLPKSIEIKFSIPENLSLVTGDATQLHQVLPNPVISSISRSFIPSSPPGKSIRYEERSGMPARKPRARNGARSNSSLQISSINSLFLRQSRIS